MTKKKGIVIGIVSFLVVTLAFLITHSTPDLALRTHLFTYGHPVKAVTVDITAYEGNDENFVGNYYLSPSVGGMYTFRVEKTGFLYFANYYGEA